MVKTSARKSEVIDNTQIMLEIGMLKQTSIQAAIESAGLSILALLVFIGAPSVFPEIINPYDVNSLKILQGIIILPFTYWLLAIIGNMIRLWKVQKLLKNLH